MNKKLSTEIAKMIDARTNMEATAEVAMYVDFIGFEFMEILKEDATEKLPKWAADKELRDLHSSVSLFQSDFYIPSKCRIAKKYRDLFVPIMTGILASLRELNQQEYNRQMHKLSALIESYKPKMEKEMNKFYTAMVNSLEKVKELDPTLMDEGKALVAAAGILE